MSAECPWSMRQTAAQLKEACRTAGLTVSGNKTALLARLQAHHTAISAKPKPQTTTSNDEHVQKKAKTTEYRPPPPLHDAYAAQRQQQLLQQQRLAQQQALEQAERQKLPDRVLELFKKYADPDNEGVIDEEGIGKLGEDMGIDPESDVSILVLCYKLKAQKPGQISQEEFVKGMTELRVDSVERLKQVLPSLDPGFMGQYEFRDFYRFVFTFSREGTKKTVEKDIVCALLPLVLPDSTRGQGATSQFVEFLEATDSVKIVTQDQWNSFLEYAKSVGTDIDRYDTDSSWPLLLDDFVEFLRAKQSGAAVKPC